MFDHDVTLRRALQIVGDHCVVLAMPYDLPQRLCHDLVTRNLVQAVVVDTVESARLDSSCAGWWVDRARDQIHLRQGVAPTLLIAGVDRARRVGPRLLLEARLKGVRRIVTTDRDGDLIEDLRVDAALFERIESPIAAPRLTGPTYEEAFEEMYALVGDSLCVRSRPFASDRLLLCLGSLGPGGAERQGAYTAVGIHERDRLETYIVCNHVDPPADFFRSYVERSGIHVVQVSDAPPELSTPEIARIYQVLSEKYWALRFEDIFLEIIRYANVLRTIRPALVHSWMDYPNALCGTAATLVGIPALVLSCRSVAPDHFRIFQPYMRPAYRALLKRRNAVILNNSRAGATDYARWLHIPEERVQIIHNGFDFPEIMSPNARRAVHERFAIPEGAQVVGSILRFSEEKRPQLMIDMARELYESDRSLRFLFFGGGVMLDEMRAYVASLNLDNVILLPGVTNTPWEVLSAMDLFVLTSRMEGLPNVLVEAQASGLPVVCTRVGGMCETFVENETGVSVEEATPSALAAAVRRILLDSDLRSRMSVRAMAHARKAFGLESMIKATHRAYARAIAQADEPQVGRLAA